MKGNAFLALVAAALILVGAGVTAYVVWHSVGRVTVRVQRLHTCYITLTIKYDTIMDAQVRCVPQTSNRHEIEWGKPVPLTQMFYHVPKEYVKIDVMDLRSTSPTWDYMTAWKLTITVYGVSGNHHAWIRLYVSGNDGVMREKCETTVDINA